MLYKKESSIFKGFVLFVALFMIISVPAYAAENASEYIINYNGYVYSAGNGELQVWADVAVPNPVDEIGMAVVSLLECPTNSTNDSDWECIYHFYYNLFPEMVTQNERIFSGCVTYEDGTVGYYYKAQITVFVEHEGYIESRTFYTATKRATHFPENA